MIEFSYSHLIAGITPLAPWMVGAGLLFVYLSTLTLRSLRLTVNWVVVHQVQVGYSMEALLHLLDSWGVASTPQFF